MAAETAHEASSADLPPSPPPTAEPSPASVADSDSSFIIPAAKKLDGPAASSGVVDKDKGEEDAEADLANKAEEEDEQKRRDTEEGLLYRSQFIPLASNPPPPKSIVSEASWKKSSIGGASPVSLGSKTERARDWQDEWQERRRRRALLEEAAKERRSLGGGGAVTPAVAYKASSGSSMTDLCPSGGSIDTVAAAEFSSEQQQQQPKHDDIKTDVKDREAEATGSEVEVTNREMEEEDASDVDDNVETAAAGGGSASHKRLSAEASAIHAHAAKMLQLADSFGNSAIRAHASKMLLLADSFRSSYKRPHDAGVGGGEGGASARSENLGMSSASGDGFDAGASVNGRGTTGNASASAASAEAVKETNKEEDEEDGPFVEEDEKAGKGKERDTADKEVSVPASVPVLVPIIGSDDERTPAIGAANDKVGCNEAAIATTEGVGVADLATAPTTSTSTTVPVGCDDEQENGLAPVSKGGVTPAAVPMDEEPPALSSSSASAITDEGPAVSASLPKVNESSLPASASSFSFSKGSAAIAPLAPNKEDSSLPPVSQEVDPEFGLKKDELVDGDDCIGATYVSDDAPPPMPSDDSTPDKNPEKDNALATKAEQSTEKKGGFCTKKILIAVAVVVIIAGVGAGVGVALGGGEVNDGDSSAVQQNAGKETPIGPGGEEGPAPPDHIDPTVLPAPTASPMVPSENSESTVAPTTAPVLNFGVDHAPPGVDPVRYDAVLSVLLSSPEIAAVTSDFALLNDPDSAQGRAVVWLSSEDTFLQYPYQIEGNEGDEEVPSPDWQVVQRYALTVLHYSFGGDAGGWLEGSRFLSPDLDVCEWRGEEGGATAKGVACAIEERTNLYIVAKVDEETGEPAESDGRVRIFLALEDNGLIGTLPEEIGLLSDLERLALKENPSMTGSLPQSIGNLESLKILDLYGCSLSGPLLPPPASDSSSTEPRGVALLSKLRYLDVGDNSFVGSLPSDLGLLNELEEMYLEFNEFDSTIPPEWGQLSKLRRLWAHSNRKGGIGGTGISGPIPEELVGLTQMESLFLWGNALTGTIPPGLGDLEYLYALSLRDNSLTGSIPPQLGNATRLEWMQLSDNEMDGPIPPELGRLEYLKELDLAGNSLAGSLPDTLFETATNLKKVYLEGNELNGTLSVNIRNWVQLKELSLSSNNFWGQIPDELGNCVSLTELSLNDNRFSGPVPQSLSNLILLESVQLSFNDLTGSLNFICASRPSDNPINDFVSDCGQGAEGKEVVCSCCNVCCHSISTGGSSCRSNLDGTFP